MTQRELELEIQKHNHLYYSGKPEITDQEYDGMIQRLKEIAPDSIILNAVGDVVGEKFNKVERSTKMQSIHDAFTEEDIRDWCNKHPYYYVCMPKLDGASCEIEYMDGVLYRASTRGDGYIGDDITHSVKTIRNVPKVIDKSGYFVVRGEVILDKVDLPEGMANCRNAAAGSLRQKDSRVAASRNLKFKAFSIVNTEFDRLSISIMHLSDLGFETVHISFRDNADSVINAFKTINNNREKLDYDIDGMVIAIDSTAVTKRVANDGKWAGHLLAAKFEAPAAITKLIDIELQKGRTGNITPIAILEPVQIAGSVVQRANLFNQNEINRLGVYKGAMVSVKKAGDIIPQIEKVITPDKSMTAHQLPTFCLDCGADLDRSMVVWKCPNRACRPERQIQYSASKNCLDILGLGNSLIKQLVDEGLIFHFTDLFKFKDVEFQKEVLKLDGWGTERVYSIAEQLRNIEITLAKFYQTLGMPTIGETKSQLIAERYFNPADFIDDYMANLLKLHHIGQESYGKMMDWLAQYIYLVDIFFRNVTIKIQKKVTDPKTFVFTGKISRPRNEYKDIVIAAGHKFSNSLSRNTDYLVCGENAGSKKSKAEAIGVKVISEDQFLEILK